eukprot:gene15569-21099_t
MATPALPADAAAWAQQRTAWMQALREKSFRGWPAAEEPLALGRRDRTGDVETWDFITQGPIRLPLTVHRPSNRAPVKRVLLYVLDRAEPTPVSPGIRRSSPKPASNPVAISQSLAGWLSRRAGQSSAVTKVSVRQAAAGSAKRGWVMAFSYPASLAVPQRPARALRVLGQRCPQKTALVRQ